MAEEKGSQYLFEPIQTTEIPGTRPPRPLTPRPMSGWEAFGHGAVSGLSRSLDYWLEDLTKSASRRRTQKSRESGFRKAGFTPEQAEALSTIADTDPQLASQMALDELRREPTVSQDQIRRLTGAQQPAQQGLGLQAQAPVQAGPLLSGQQPISERLLQGLAEQTQAPQPQQQQPWMGGGPQQPQQLPFVPAPPAPRPQAPPVAPAGAAPGGPAGLMPGRGFPEEVAPEAERPFGRRPGYTAKQLQDLQKERERQLRRAEDVEFRERELGFREKEAVRRLKLREKENKFREKEAKRRLDLKEKEMKHKRRIEEKKMSLEERKERHAEQKEINKETLPMYKEVIKASKGAVDNSMRLNRIEKLNEKGNLGYPLLNAVIEMAGKGIWGAGINLDFLMTADAQELKKLSTDFLKNIKDYFGARITNAEINLFMKTLPTLSQSKSGIRKVINNLRIFNDAAQIRKNVMDELIAENGGLRPANLESKVERRMKSKMDALADRFKNSLAGPQEAGEGLIGYGSVFSSAEDIAKAPFRWAGIIR